VPERDPTFSRRDVLSNTVRGAGLLATAGALVAIAADRDTTKVWQIDPFKCVQCGKCATSCVLHPSAVRCLNVFPMCGYCKLCTGYFVPDPVALDEGAENQLCPTGALKRKWVEDLFYEYTVEPDQCIGCAKCVKGCLEFGNGSLFLQIDQTLCVRCNQCSIAAVCPSQAISRVPIEKPYILVNRTRSG
jgi:Na+-translocating ferredoxin:NAD+ oxidoreductase subunit B